MFGQKSPRISSSTSKSSAICLRISGRSHLHDRRGARRARPRDAPVRATRRPDVFLKKRERFGDADASSLATILSTLAVRKRFDLVLQTRERLQIGFRQKVGAGWKATGPNLMEGRPHFFPNRRPILSGAGWPGLAAKGVFSSPCGLTGKFLGQIGIAVFPKTATRYPCSV